MQRMYMFKNNKIVFFYKVVPIYIIYLTAKNCFSLSWNTDHWNYRVDDWHT